MSKASKTRASAKRAKDKRGRKDAQKAQYAAWAASGTNSKRSRNRARRIRTVSDTNHPDGRCGNIACFRCCGEIAIPAAVRLRSLTHGEFEGARFEKFLIAKYS